MRVYFNEQFRELGLSFTEPNAGDAGYDLYATEACMIEPGERGFIPTGVHMEIPAGYVGFIKDRSSMALKGLHNLGGVIDSAYRGEVKIITLNTTKTPVQIEVGQKVAQIVILACYTEPVDVVDDLETLTSTDRGEGGFGSTGT